ncbi:phenylalanine--tRNA ligase subunit beta [Helicobacter mesocricetorum]|uniref:phenylalanine--tRNA ligase subunit beta n=1 Tax=Helicobacter mesocricetorum TaxID=87012 RepID=UPI000CF19968|nr:phenylalanine--tRNA ligase subunit beta [Helicobacter mesocricetorum]
MRFTRSILKTILPLGNITGEIICITLNKIGLEVESFQRLVAPKRVVVGKILTCKKHPDAQKLNICEVAIGGKEGEYQTHQIVCGAKNAREGIFVAVALEGAVLPQITIKKAVLRGVESCGMLCSSLEIGFPKTNDGIMELDNSLGELILGKELLEYDAFNDEIFEISITPNRGDCMSVIGIARELSVGLNLEMQSLKMPKISENSPGIGRVLQITTNEKHESSLMYKVIELHSTLTPCCLALFLAYNEVLEEDWLSNVLTFATFYSGVILNAYPQNFCQLEDKSQINKMVLKLKKDELGFESIYFEEKKLSTIGVESFAYKGFKHNGDKEFIILEASYIPPEIIAQKVLETNIEVDSKIFQRVSRGSNPDLKVGLDVFGSFLNNEGIVFYTDTQELLQVTKKESITIDILLLSKVIGCVLDKITIVNILKALEFKVELPADENLVIATPPLFRHDVVGFQDIAEEIIRFVGIDNVPSKPLSFVQNNQINQESEFYHFQRKLSKKAVSIGFNEVVHFVFCNREILEKYGFETLEEKLELLNPITQDLNTLRPTLLMGLIQAAAYNKNNGFNAISFVEIGFAYDKKRQENIKMAFLQSGLACEEHYPKTKGVRADFFAFADRIACVIGEFTLEVFQSNVKIFHPNQCAKIFKGKKEIGILAALHPALRETFGLEETYLCELDLKSLRDELPKVERYSKFQKVVRDLSILVPKEIPYYKLKEKILQLPIDYILKFYPLDVYSDESLEDKISLTIRFEIQSYEKTLEEKDIVEVMDKVLEALKAGHKVELR